MLLGPIGKSILSGDNGVPTNRLPYNSRQRKPSIDSDSSSTGDNSDGPSSDEYKFVETSHPQEVLIGLNGLRNEGQFCDVTLCVDGVKFPAHRNVLASFSPYFKAMFTNKLAESKQSLVAVNGVEPGMMSLLLDYAYTSAITITRSNVQALLSAANLLQILPVRDAACLFLERHMDSNNCVGIHCFAETHACTDLQHKALQYTLKNFRDVAYGEEFLSLTAAKLIEFISSDDLQVFKEETVFQAVIRWFNHNPDERRPDFHKVLENVRLPLLSPYFLHDCVESQLVVRQCPECCQLVDEAKMFHLLPDRRAELQTSRTKHRNSAGTVQVIVAVGGEDDKVVLRSVECYDPNSRQWRTLACLPFAVREGDRVVGFVGCQLLHLNLNLSIRAGQHSVQICLPDKGCSGPRKFEIFSLLSPTGPTIDFSKHGLVASGKNTVYLAGGEFPDGSASSSVWRYDPVLNVWQEMAPMLVSRSELGLAMLDGYVYAVGGWEGSFRLDSVERYNPETNSWFMIPPMRIAVTSPAVVAHDGMLYVTGGAVLEDGDGIELVQRYDPKSNTWTELAPMLIPRSGSAACVLDGHIYVVGGWHASTENTNKVERYDVQRNVWEFKASMIERRYRPGVAVIDRHIFVLGGEEGWDRYHDTIELYSADTDTWQVTGDMPTSRSWLSCVPLQVRKFPARVES